MNFNHVAGMASQKYPFKYTSFLVFLLNPWLFKETKHWPFSCFIQQFAPQ